MKSVVSRPGLFSSRPFIAVASLLLAALLLFLFLPRNPGPYRAIPAQSSVVLECTGLLRARILADKTSDPGWRAVLQDPWFQQCFKDAELAARLFKHDPDLLRAFAQNKALAAFSLHPSDELHALFALELDRTIDLEKVLKNSKLATKYIAHQFHGNDLYTVYLSPRELLEVTLSGQVLLFSRKATLVEDAVAELENARNWWADRPYFRDLAPAPLRLHLRPAAFAEQYRSQMNPRWRGLPDLLARNVEWVGLSWDGKTVDALAETKGFLSKLGSWGSPPDGAIFKVLPDNTAFLARAGLSNIPEFFKQMGDGRSSDFEQYILPWVGGEVALAVTEPLSPALAGDRLILLAVRDSAKALSSLRSFARERGALPGASGSYQMFEILGFQSATLLQPLLGEDEAFRNPVGAMVGGYVIFASDRSSLEIQLDKFLVNQTLATNTDFLQLQQKLPGKGRASFLLNTAYLSGLLQNLTDSTGETALSATGLIAAELQTDWGRKTTLSLANQSLSQPIAETDILWKTPLAAQVAGKPCLVEQQDGRIFGLVQDQKHSLHCFDLQNGAILWSKPLPERILSDLQGIDYFGSGLNCYIFSTATQVFILDENGREVQGYPFKLPARASHGIRVVDFDKTKKFNYFVACENEKIYGYGHLGKPLDGWNGLSTEGRVRESLLHFQHSGMDFLAILTEKGLLSVFGRDGSPRFPPIQLEGFQPEAGDFNCPLVADIASANPHIYAANANGQIFACDLKGQVTTYTVGKPGITLAFGQLTGDARFEWAALDGNSLTLGSFLNPGSPLFKTRFPVKQQLVFFRPNNRLGVVDKFGRRVWLLDSQGKILPGFPLGGNTAFEFARLHGVDMLVVGNGNGIWAYRVRQ